jgi:hypothetical protein
MKITNTSGLPQTLVNVMQRDPYTRGGARLSVTQLIGSPRISILRARHDDQMVMDVTDGIWSMMGRAMHSLAEAGADANHIAEERIHTKVLGWDLSGGIDLQRLLEDTAIIEDYKVTSAWAVMNEKPEWEHQLNVYAYLVTKEKGWKVEALNVIAFIRDWARMKASTQEGYPSAPVIRVPVKLWTFAEQEAYVEARVQLHQSAATSDQFDDDLPHCTDEERWVKQSKFAVMKPGRKTAVRVFDTKAEAKQWIDDQGAGAIIHKDLFYIEERPGAATRCAENFCSVSQWCTQWQAEKGETE